MGEEINWVLVILLLPGIAIHAVLSYLFGQWVVALWMNREKRKLNCGDHIPFI